MTAKIIQFTERVQVRVCSFCKKPEAACKQFIASNVSNHCICGDCVKIAAERAKAES